MNLLTRRLILHPLTPELVTAQLERRASFFKQLSASPRLDWPPPLYDDAALNWTLTRLSRGEDPRWHIRVLTTIKPVLGRSRAVGVAGFKGPPDARGEVEIGYSIVAGEQRRGFCTEAVDALLEFAFSDSRVAFVSAHTLDEDALAPSKKVLERKNFGGPFSTQESRVIRYELPRESFFRARGVIREGDSQR